MWLRISSSGSFSSAERLISSISRRCRRTLASRSLSLSSGLAVGGGGGSGAGSGNPVEETVSAIASSSAGTRAGAATWCVEKRPAIKDLPYQRPAISKTCHIKDLPYQRPAISMSYDAGAAHAAVDRPYRAHDSLSFLPATAASFAAIFWLC